MDTKRIGAIKTHLSQRLRPLRRATVLGARKAQKPTIALNLVTRFYTLARMLNLISPKMLSLPRKLFEGSTPRDNAISAASLELLITLAKDPEVTDIMPKDEIGLIFAFLKTFEVLDEFEPATYNQLSDEVLQRIIDTIIMAQFETPSCTLQ